MKNKNLILYFDNYNIYNLIKKIDAGYRLYFDRKEKNFVILNSAKNDCFCLKSDTISPILLKKLIFTRVENSKKIYDFIENCNQNLMQNRIICTEDNAKNKVNELNYFLSRTNTLSQKDIDYFKG